MVRHRTEENQFKNIFGRNNARSALSTFKLHSWTKDSTEYESHNPTKDIMAALLAEYNQENLE